MLKTDGNTHLAETFRWAAKKRVFILFLTIIRAVVSASSSLERSRPAGTLLLVVAGALWTSALRQLFGALVRMRRTVDSPMTGASVQTVATSQKFRRWRRSLAQFAGWQYPLRLASGLGFAAALRSLWPDHHAGHHVNSDLVIERLVATFIGTLLVTLISLVFRRMAPSPLPLLQKWP